MTKWCQEYKGEKGEGSQKVETSSYIINKSWGWNVGTVVSSPVLHIWKLLSKY